MPMTSQMPNRSHACAGKPDHDEQAGGDAKRGNDPDERHLERPRAVGLFDAQHQHAGADQREREQRPDVGQVVGLGRIADQRTPRPPGCR